MGYWLFFVVLVLAQASGKAERSLKKAGKRPVFRTFSSETQPISSLPHYFLTRWNADVQRAQAHLSEEVRKYFAKNLRVKAQS
jgi:hypothetical protein